MTTAPEAPDPDAARDHLRAAREALKADGKPAAIRELADEVDDILRRYLAESSSE